MPNQDRQHGTVVTWIPGSAYGFIAPHDGGADLFAHVTSLPGGLDCLRVGQRVSYDSQVDRHTGKPRAINVEVMN
ncbi:MULTISPECIES: cold shock domain-containing protein [unclassified Mesorhizobium]|uniref:cold-shock protein n=1 Tax=unclassified Mesorhizobium TaxID=325217 RepID=UPI0003CDE7FA|nr:MULTISPECIES: cold shock domain-containing protein [unclassified Mesorhizobium]ESY58016.1 cold-shock protein [Mesorhizobium sp. LNJC374B00]ESY58862.1 cold-shock protein [Mesorhizobium sp. LNJC372A00]WJI79502.1 cold shock domain-containing protein [Mesorhizobium sp. C374B]WJI86037.1 cold shock domain-containing protein [Mesorhizobium sp. C372A]